MVTDDQDCDLIEKKNSILDVPRSGRLQVGQRYGHKQETTGGCYMAATSQKI